MGIGSVFVRCKISYMINYIKKAFTEPPAGLLNNNVWKYGFLAVILALLAFNIHWFVTLPSSYPYDKYGNLNISIMLLLDHLAFSFKWPKMVTVTIRGLACLWILFCFAYLLNTSIT